MLVVGCRGAGQCVCAGGHLLAGAHHPDDVPHHRPGHAEGGRPEPAPQGLPLLLLLRYVLSPLPFLLLPVGSYSFSCACIDSFARSLPHSLTHPLTHSLNCLFACVFIPSRVFLLSCFTHAHQQQVLASIVRAQPSLSLTQAQSQASR